MLKDQESSYSQSCKNYIVLSDDDDSDSSQFDESKCLQENKPLLNSCQVCKNSSDGVNMYFCDKCDDGYHNYCLPSKWVKPSSQASWICERCIREERQAKILLSKKPAKIIEVDSIYCQKCKKPLAHERIQEIYFGMQPRKICFQFDELLPTKKCLYCMKNFHSHCFNMRSEALNCSKCEKEIRHKCPKGHEQFIQYYQEKFNVFRKQNYFTLEDSKSKIGPSNKNRARNQKFSFKIPAPVTNWQLITKYEASIYYAFETKKLNFIEDQIYDSVKVMDMNRWDRDCVPILELNPDDEKVFQIFKSNTRNGVIVGPYEIKEDPIKGFHIIATDFIEKMTIITEYVGEVVPARKSLFHHNQNDSIFMLIRNSSSSLSLDIVPHHFGNIARFFSGINNESKEGKKLLNVEAIRFSYQGRVRIIFYAKKNIQAGDVLYFDYNGSPFHEYPTEKFQH